MIIKRMSVGVKVFLILCGLFNSYFKAFAVSFLDVTDQILGIIPETEEPLRDFVQKLRNSYDEGLLYWAPEVVKVHTEEYWNYLKEEMERVQMESLSLSPVFAVESPKAKLSPDEFSPVSCRCSGDFSDGLSSEFSMEVSGNWKTAVMGVMDSNETSFDLN